MARAGAAVCVTAAAVLMITGCGGVPPKNESSSSSSGGRDTPSSSAPTTSRKPSSPDATLDDLKKIVVPAHCRMPPSTLESGTVRASAPASESDTSSPTSPPSPSSSPSSTGPDQADAKPTSATKAGHGALVMAGPSAPVLVDVDGDGAKEAVAEYRCEVGGTTWPSMIVAVRHGGEVVNSVRLGDISHTEHAYVTGWHPKEGGVAVSWVAFDGAGADKKPYENLLAASGAAARFTPTERGRALGYTSIVDGPGKVAFVVPTGRIACRIEGPDVACAVNQPTWSPEGEASSEGCVEGTKVVGLRNGRVGYDCQGQQPFKAAAESATPPWHRSGSDPAIRGQYGEMPGLAYGRTLTTGKVTCTVALTGVTCTDPVTGHGFTVSTDAVRSF